MIGETYRDVEVRYLIDEDRWRFTANGRERTVDTLVKARESIDRSLANVSSKKERPFEPFEAYMLGRYGNGASRVTVTSFAEARSRYDKHGYAWIKTSDGKRSKESTSILFVVSPANDALIQEIINLEKQGQDIDVQIGNTTQQLTPVQAPSGVVGGEDD